MWPCDGGERGGGPRRKAAAPENEAQPDWSAVAHLCLEAVGRLGPLLRLWKKAPTVPAERADADTKRGPRKSAGGMGAGVEGQAGDAMGNLKRTVEQGRDGRKLRTQGVAGKQSQKKVK
ncbi:hypothetical protein ERJ75_000634100 [Trypanosoma vivax]|nr:hypothetical protein ERJ75_000634100 [Trypanosoma vivax]